jgi:hypothetical protein
MKIAIPTIHLNGSNAESLKNEYIQAYIVAGELLNKLQAIDLNGRDYYVQADERAFEQARQESSARYMAVKTIRAELDHIIAAIERQQ